MQGALVNSAHAVGCVYHSFFHFIFILHILFIIPGINAPNMGNTEIKDSSPLLSCLRKSDLCIKEGHYFTPQSCLLQVQSWEMTWVKVVWAQQSWYSQQECVPGSAVITSTISTSIVYVLSHQSNRNINKSFLSECNYWGPISCNIIYKSPNLFLSLQRLMENWQWFFSP